MGCILHFSSTTIFVFFRWCSMDKNYSFLSDTEPTDEQLAWLMHEVGEEVRKQGVETNRKFREELHHQVVEAQERWAKLTAGKNDDA